MHYARLPGGPEVDEVGGGGVEEIPPHSGTGQALVPPSAPLNVVDCIASILFILSLIGETVADNQQCAFQNGKRAWRLANSTTRTSAGLCDAGGGEIVGSSPRPHSSIERQYDDGFCECFFTRTAPGGATSLT